MAAVTAEEAEVDGSAATAEEETEMEASGPEFLHRPSPSPTNLRRRIGTPTAFRPTSWFS